MWFLASGAGDLSRVHTVAWRSPHDEVVLEVQDPNTKSVSDTDRSAWVQIFKELEESGITEYSINNHDLVMPAIADGPGPMRLITLGAYIDLIYLM